jgi:hypothetical protein
MDKGNEAKMVKITRIVLGMLLLSGLLFSEENLKKRTILSSMKESYLQLPKEVDTINELFSEGIFYGRLRFNSFGFRWGEERSIADKVLRKDHAIAAIGGSLIYKSAYLHGFGFTLAGYTTQARGTLDSEEAYLYKGGKGLLSRYDSITQGKQGISVFAQAYLEYHKKNTYVKAGRFIFESFLTASNDTKMIPNTFEGVSLETTDFKNTLLKVAYLSKQKLRDHSDFHSVLAKADAILDDPFNVYTGSDDSGTHHGLKKSKIDALGIKDRLMIVDMRNHSIENLILRMNYTALPELVSSAMLQVDYEMHFLDMDVTPAFRYMQQFDNGAGAIGGANLKTVTTGYTDPDSLDSYLMAARVDIANHVWKMRFGYTQIADKGDLIAPWRGFPTAGFSRAMAQYNWYANTKTYMIRADFDFDSAGLIPGVEAFMRFAVQDFDDDKAGTQADSNVLTLDVLKEFSAYPGFYMKLRVAHVDGDDDTVAYKDDKPYTKLDPSYDEVRFEINYLF